MVRTISSHLIEYSYLTGARQLIVRGYTMKQLGGLKGISGTISTLKLQQSWIPTMYGTASLFTVYF
jgi:hypothetical protein